MCVSLKYMIKSKFKNSPHKGDFNNSQVRHHGVLHARCAGFRAGEKRPVLKALERRKDND